jgi:quercetin dioxygenase-like cupin family protein
MSTPKSRYVIRPGNVPSYSPAHHTGTRNTRLIVPSVNGAQMMEVVLGEVDRGAGASNHAHPGVERAQYFLEGEAVVEVEGETHRVGPGDMCFFPAGVFHKITALSPRMKVLVGYAPPYGEAPTRSCARPSRVS